ncbi:MAG: hypothetical protein H7A25_21845 [Leptospiraceae bacterium]|nr:hypothetical protein [Leptospiraceae bacterium]MCP5502557.1 hypothetical protein [Leptospiraceae bacterium]
MKVKALKYIAFFTILFNAEICVGLSGFGMRGPFQHNIITLEAIRRFSKKKGVNINFACASVLIHGSEMNDIYFSHDPSYHCDNDINACTLRLKQLFDTSRGTISPVLFQKNLGIALHIVQDFYSHSNWVEIFEQSYYLAPTMLFQNFPPPENLQSGAFPDAAIALTDPENYTTCYSKEGDEIKHKITAATHDCINKDSNYNWRGRQFVPNSGITYHELAAEYAIRHSIKLLEKAFADSKAFLKCTPEPKVLNYGCNAIIERNKIHFGKQDE